MKRAILALWMAMAASAAWAGGWTSTHSLTGGSVGLTNTQANSSWVPVSVMLKFTAAGSGTAEVWRVSQEHNFMLANCIFSNVTTVVWVPDAEYPFILDEALVIRSSLTNGIVQVIRKGD
jgi:hypothetical protein